MRYCYQVKCIRKSFEMTQKEFGELLGVSATTICRFEDGREVNDYIFKRIKYGIDNYMKSLPTDKYIETRLRQQIYLLDYEKDVNKKLIALNHIAMNIAKLELSLIERVESE